MNIWCDRLLPGSLHLAHVFPWAAIDKCVNSLIYNSNNSNDLKEFVELIFRVDWDAIAPNAWLLVESVVSWELPSPGWPISHGTYLWQDLIDLNRKMLQEALFNCITKQPLGLERTKTC